ncbi:cytochrome c3 family protein [Rhodopirellula sallentina]|uniref:Putative secreted protein n=1 Tax=Rhodopirellula sallentina SM41 TaxID=1263870 RepID=M5TXL8_9BACT|nr:cytochrome c3 family protein [Rhodopirellula sallentina]EMI53972.1 putative secreted protein [Rhodopirellula sallentina SM41]
MARSINLIFVGTVLVVVSMVGVVIARQSTFKASPNTQQASDNASSSDAHSAGGETTSFPVVIHQPDGPPRVKLAGLDPQGRTGEVACSTCHAVRQPNFENKTTETLDEFHQGLVVAHGNLSCYSCHNPDGSDTLRQADGTKIEYQDVMTLCSQCHGPQATAYAHGAHGGMNGHWDLSRGPQVKNNCVDCHDPHSPAYPKMVVGFKPKDRFNTPVENAGH